MTSFKDSRDFILLSYEIGLINGDHLLPLSDRTTAVISTTKQNINTDEKLDLSTDGLLVQQHISTAFRPDTNMTEVIISA